MTAMPPTATILTSLANPKVKAATALRDRRERDRTGLTLLDGAREIRRAIDAGAEVTEVYVCEPLLAGPDARAVLDRLRGGGVVDQPTVSLSSRSSPTATGSRGSSRSPGSRRSSCPARAAGGPAGRRRRGRREAGQPRCGAARADGAGADAVIAADPADRPVQPERRSGQRRARCSPSRSPPRRRRRARAGSGGRAPDRRGDGRRRTPTRPSTCADRWRSSLGSEADGLTDAWSGDDVDGGPAADARRGRQPQRVDRRGRPAVRGAATARRSGRAD